MWEKSSALFGDKVTASVDAQLPQEISHVTRVTFTLYAMLPTGKPDRIDSKDTHIQDGKAKAELTLWAPGARGDDGKPIQKCDYYFLAKHSYSKELKSKNLPARAKGKYKGRPLQRGFRGEDVLGWQKFLMNLRAQAEFSGVLPEIKIDGIFGLQTQKATQDFQAHVGVEPTGVVAEKTREQAEAKGAVFEEFATKGFTSAPADSVQQGKIPVLPVEPPLPQPPAPPGPQGSTREVSWKRLRAEGWSGAPAVKSGLESDNAKLQSAADGTGDFVYDEYKVDVLATPPGLTPAAFLIELAKDLNGTIKNPDFDEINVFARRNVGQPKIGEIIDIDIAGPDNGSVVLGELDTTYFVFQTIECPKTRTHPENGSREFGFQINGNLVTYYTRGVSRPGNYFVGLLGAVPQRKGWTALMHGISSQINVRGGKSDFASFSWLKEKHDK